MRMDWTQCSATYDGLAWVSKDELLDAMADAAGVCSGQHVLDLGTGTGKVLMALYERCPDASYAGVDMCPDMLARIDASYGFTLLVREIEDLHGLPDNHFDVVTARMVFHHANDTEKAMAEASRVLNTGGRFVICEGNPPDRHCIPFFEAMFKLKEDRITFLLDDLVNLLVRQDFKDIRSRTVILRDMSLNNWLEKSVASSRNVEIITAMHRECDEHVQRAYNMQFVDGDIRMDWKFSIVTGTKQ